MGLVDRVTELIEPIVASLGAELIDVEHAGGILRVTVDEGSGISLDRLAEVTHAISRCLDDADPVPGHYTLEVSSPGLERPLRTPVHFTRAVGQKVSVKTKPTFDGERRFVGILVTADEAGFSVSTGPGDAIAVAYADVDRARTVFEWGPSPKPGKGSRPGGRKKPAGQQAGSDRAGQGGQGGQRSVGADRSKANGTVVVGEREDDAAVAGDW